MTTYRAATSRRLGLADGEEIAVCSAPGGQRVTSRAFEMAMEPTDVHVGEARDATVAVLCQWALPDSVAEDARLVVSELVTNAIRHGSGAVKLQVRHCGRHVLVGVTDGSSTPARQRRAATSDVGGRGLYLVAHLSWRWGVADDGRTTYAVLPSRPEGEGNPATRLASAMATEAAPPAPASAWDSLILEAH
ncbi:ATP-binding protein [Streptomyces sp. NPDC102384]|uniref:ATP-binding protein n=1 Tax=Streptomyces sp. NPDC102384 TaxID=3366166 RepID=UPI00382D3A1E